MSSAEKSAVVSMSGSPILRHSEAAPFEGPQGEECIEQISDHIEAHLGQIETVFHEIVSDTVHIDVHFVKATETFPFVRLVTSGMSDLPMSAPEDSDVPKFVEVLMTLPGNWKLDQDSLSDEHWYWPIRLMKGLARLPHKHKTWLGWGHTVPNGDPAEPYASSTKLCGAILLPSVTVPEGFHKLRIDQDKEITFFSIVPLYEEEMRLKLRSGSDALLNRFDKTNVNDIVDPSRRNSAKKNFGLF
ncbi:Suppressor of fused protein (SUFU) [Hydrocarboniphaga daqingensis]|uniref:Suppressor of fused protein (SUFU) n=1 Tax=Hydrocarboniphaga daqingensis TaxID=490188 RepID=A0A1M5KB34_9GAMM|nr:suppressor of fused domain protein [Hydrocarboniphaga daqingensis]SHG50012.1 Suppressor of fused protein (SUFU) [Hydrocarboniphaga daqingensis]